MLIRLTLGTGPRMVGVWLAACLSALTGCGSADDSPPGNTHLNEVLLITSEAVDIQLVEAALDCPVSGSPFVNPDTLDQLTSIGQPSVLSVLDPQPDLPENQMMWTGGFLDLPPGLCTFRFRARNGDGEIVCSTEHSFLVATDTTTEVNVVFQCDVSDEPPPAPSNECPQLQTLLCSSDAGSTSCDVTFSDEDGTCAEACDPQTCIPTPDGLLCTPGPDPGIATIVACTDALLECPGEMTDDDACLINAATPGLSMEGGTLRASFSVSCLSPSDAGEPETSPTCTITTTDGDVDCDEIEVIELGCPLVQAPMEGSVLR